VLDFWDVNTVFYFATQQTSAYFAVFAPKLKHLRFSDHDEGMPNLDSRPFGCVSEKDLGETDNSIKI